MSDTAPGTKNLKVDRHGPKGKPDTIALLKEQSSKRLLTTFYCTRRPVLHITQSVLEKLPPAAGGN